jgi:hypothetical protein
MNKQPTDFSIANPSDYLTQYIAHAFGHMQLNPLTVQRQGEMIKSSVIMHQGGESYIFSLMLPANAPHGARPLCVKVIHQERKELLWEYNQDHKPHVPWGRTERVHLACFETKLILVHIDEAYQGRVVRVTDIFGSSLSVPLQALLKVHFARLWGLSCRVSKLEKEAIEKAK